MTRFTEFDVMDQDDGEHGSVRIDWWPGQVYVEIEYSERGKVGVTLDLHDLDHLIRRLTEASALASTGSA